MDIFDFPYVLIKIVEINDTNGCIFNHIIGEKTLATPLAFHVSPMTIQNNELWNEFIEINENYTICESDKQQIECGYYQTTYGHEIWGPSVGESFVLRSKTSSGIRTSTVTDILSDNIFITMNSVYFLVNDSWRKKQNRDKKINEIINGEI